MLKSLLRYPLGSLLAVSIGVLAPLSQASPLGTHEYRQADAWPFGPLVTSGRDIKDTRNQTVVYAGVNWPGHGEVMIPDGLTYQSIETVVTKIKSVGVNAIRLTYAIQMIDEIYDNGGDDITVRAAFIQALGEANGTARFEEFLQKNPIFDESTTRLQVYDAVAEECAKQEIYINLDNHMSQGAWCCNTRDGNSWFGDTYFDVDSWTRGLAYMADHGRSWTALTSMSLRNELRRPDNNPQLEEESYHWQDWYKYMRQGADAVNGANPDVLVVLSGLDFDTWLNPVVEGTALVPGSGLFDRADFAGYGADKLVLELHNYANNAADCGGLKRDLYAKGYRALHPEDPKTADVFPVLLTEFGFAQATAWESVYATCLAEMLAEERAGWFIWVMAGSYYIRSGIQDYEETWGLLNHDWSDWRSPDYIEQGFMPLVRDTASP
ncbi:hypothetical protein DL768_004289 [Monosporascus sp. mg162]|nr:hypothetical protein DL768_004289 [Monosporascus sp. mg162]